MSHPHRVGTSSFHFLRLGRAFAVGVVLAAGILTSSAQTSENASRIYRLAKTATFQRGCFAPCLCPVMETGGVEGTFVLTPTGAAGSFRTYSVTEVNWSVTLPSGPIRVTGGGSYQIGGYPVQQQLLLDLKVGDDPVQHFDSGLVAGGGDFPRIAVTISIHGQYCFDTAFGVDASPVPTDEVHSYKLLPQSTYQRSCGGPCACAPGPVLPIRGSFSLVDLDPTPLFNQFAVTMVKWQVAPDPSSAAASGLPVSGDGFYRMGGEFAVQQQMSLELSVGTEPSAMYDSGLLPGGGAFPRIDVKIENGAGTCVTTVIDLHAKPALSGRMASPSPENSSF
jgi:hypothetical protein